MTPAPANPIHSDKFQQRTCFSESSNVQLFVPTLKKIFFYFMLESS